MRYVNAWLKKYIFLSRFKQREYAILQFKESCLLFEYVKIAMYCFSITRLQCQMMNYIKNPHIKPSAHRVF